MKRFWLIQRGYIRRKGGPSLIGQKGVIELDYMGSAEFEHGAIPNAYCEMMYNFNQYRFYSVKIRTVVNKTKTLSVFCREQYADKIIAEILNFIDNPYQLKEPSNMEMIKQVADITKPWSIMRTRFWWCIDSGELGNWIAFLKDDYEKIWNAIVHDYFEWWMPMSKEERDEKYKEAMNCKE